MKNNIDEDIKIVKEHIKELDEEKILYGGFLSRKEALENVLSELETYKKIAEKLADELSKHIWLNDKDAILKIYREKVEEDETHS